MLRPPPRPTLFPYTRSSDLLHQHTGLVVERAERLVEQQDLGIIGERTRNGAALLHAAGQLLRPVVLEAVQPNLLDETVGDRVALVFRHAAFAQAEEIGRAHG